MRTIRASELGTFIFCERAWWYRLNSFVPENLEDLTFGTDFHFRQTKRLILSRYLRILGFGLLLLAFILGVIFFTGQFG
jgi:hypothetical protein